MSNIAELHQYYADIKIGDLSGNQKKQLYKQLSNIHTEDVITLHDHKKFVELLRILRQASMEDMDLVGQKFRDTLKSLLSVGEDGVYINKLRFIYELIQNVDDCEYKDVSDCNLDIQFRYERDPGLIILTPAAVCTGMSFICRSMILLSSQAVVSFIIVSDPFLSGLCSCFLSGSHPGRVLHIKNQVHEDKHRPRNGYFPA